MIKYFYFEYHFHGSIAITKNERVLYDDPLLEDKGFKTIYESENISINYVDVEKRIKFRGSFDNDFQEVYDKLMLEQRNLKLNTL